MHRPSRGITPEEALNRGVFLFLSCEDESPLARASNVACAQAKENSNSAMELRFGETVHTLTNSIIVLFFKTL